MEWSAAQYTKFEAERTRPVRDLLAAVPARAAARVIDLGCGPGNSTEVLAQHYPHAVVEALDSSPDMLAAARRRLPTVVIHAGDIATWQADSPYDVILSNAVLHWLPSHETLLPRLLGMLAPGGSLAVQMPDNLAEPSHTLMNQPGWPVLRAVAAGERTPLGDAGFYYRLAAAAGASAQIWRTTYYHVLEGAAGVVDWFRGSGLRPFLAALPDSERDAYLACYRAAVEQAYPPQPDGRVLLALPRLFLVMTRETISHPG
jgi:trans-aconitate 2-methyltransferase